MNGSGPWKKERTSHDADCGYVPEMMNPLQQILLPGFAVRSDAFFSNFYAPGSLKMVKDSLIAQVKGNNGFAAIYLCGIHGAGKSHLLQATCNLAEEQGKTSLFLPLREIMAFTPSEILENAGDADVVCLDDVDLVAGNPAWEEALFHLYNQCQLAGHVMIMSGSVTVNDMSCYLPDWKTRLTSCLVMPLRPMDEDDKAGFVSFCAQHTGMQISESCIQFIISHGGRSAAELVKVVERLDRESLVAGRKITVPFIKQVFGW